MEAQSAGWRKRSHSKLRRRLKVVLRKLQNQDTVSRLLSGLLVVLEPTWKVAGLPRIIEVAVLRIPPLRRLPWYDVDSHPQGAVGAETHRASAGCMRKHNRVIDSWPNIAVQPAASQQTFCGSSAQSLRHVACTQAKYMPFAIHINTLDFWMLHTCHMAGVPR